MAKSNYREIQLLALLYKVEELMLELQVGGRRYNDLVRIIAKLKKELEDNEEGQVEE